jgi:hypothetical protein
MRQLVITPKFRRAYRKLAKRDHVLQVRIGDVFRQMQADVLRLLWERTNSAALCWDCGHVHVATTVAWSFPWTPAR